MKITLFLLALVLFSGCSMTYITRTKTEKDVSKTTRVLRATLGTDQTLGSLDASDEDGAKIALRAHTANQGQSFEKAAALAEAVANPSPFK